MIADPDRLEHVKAMHRSVSQVKTYQDCPYRYYLERVVRAWQRPAAWLPQGTAVHKAAEAYERSGRAMSVEDAQGVYRDTYVEEVDRYLAAGRYDTWYWSGPYDGASDTERRWGIGLEQVKKYIQYYEAHTEEVIWITPDGEPAIELGFDIELDGVKIRGFIDQMIQLPDGKVRARDIKSGNTPGSVFQLKTYAVAISALYDQPVSHGDYFMTGKKGKPAKPTAPYDLFEWGREEVTSEFVAMDRGVKAERFDAKPEAAKCDRCSVSDACPFSLA